MAASDGRSRRWWFDPRFAIGLVLIVVAVAGTAFVVTSADSSVEVLAARSALTPGQPIAAADVVTTRVGMERAGEVYLQPVDLKKQALLVTRTVSAGELVPASAVGSGRGLDSTTLVLAVHGQLSESIVPGATADVWAAAEAEGGGFAPPAVIAPAATVVRLVKPQGVVSDASSGSVEVLVPKDTVARLLEAVANEDQLSLVPASVPTEG